MTNALKWRIAIVLVIVFAAGVATGLLAGARHARHVFFARHSAHFGDRMREHLKQELKLTPEQYEKVAPVIDEMGARLELIRDETSKRVADTMGESHNKIVPLLNEEQRSKLDRMKRRHHRMLRFRGIHSDSREGHRHSRDDH